MCNANLQISICSQLGKNALQMNILAQTSDCTNRANCIESVSVFLFLPVLTLLIKELHNYNWMISFPPSYTRNTNFNWSRRNVMSNMRCADCHDCSLVCVAALLVITGSSNVPLCPGLPGCWLWPTWVAIHQTILQQKPCSRDKCW